MRAHAATLAITISLLALLATAASAQLLGPFCVTESDPAEAIALFIAGDGNQFVGSGSWLRRPVSLAGGIVDGSINISLTIPAFPPKGNPLSCGAVINPATGEGPLRCARSAAVAIDGTLRGTACVAQVAPADRMLVVGNPTPATQQVAAILAAEGLPSRVNGGFLLGGTALFTFSALDGPTPQTREVLNRLAGDDASRAAIVVTDAPQAPDPELLDLAILEMRELLALFMGQPAADALPVLRSDAANFSALVRGLPINPFALGAP